ncbi:MAG: HEAT repeat domain-containing protein [Planctomycetota bacterium]
MPKDFFFSHVLEPLSAISAISELHDLRSLDVLAYFIQDADSSITIRANSIYYLSYIYKGMPANRMGENEPVTKSIALTRANDLAGYYKEREFSKVEVDEAKQKSIVALFEQLLLTDPDRQIRATAALSLKHASDSVKCLVEALSKDNDPCVRAWCVMSLRAIGGEKVQEALTEALKIEKHEEVKAVLENKAQPFSPLFKGRTAGSILDKRVLVPPPSGQREK